MADHSQLGTHSEQFDVFISYSHTDKEFVRALAVALERFHVPEIEGARRRRLNIFRDERELTGTDYDRAIDTYLEASRKFIVICSPAAYASRYVDDEIRRWSAMHPGSEIIPVLLAGRPNNECEDEAERAFPPALTEFISMPLAVGYQGFDVDRDRFDAGAFFNSWYTLLANILDVSRAEIEQRDQKRRRLVRRNIILATTSLIITLSVLTLIAILQRNEAIRQRNAAVAQGLAAQGELLLSNRGAALHTAVLLAAQGVRRAPSLAANNALLKGLSLLSTREQVFKLDGPGSPRDVSLVSSRLAEARHNGTVNVWNLQDHALIASIEAGKPVKALLLRPDGRRLFLETDVGVSVFDIGKQDPVTVIADASLRPSAAFSPNGRYLAVWASDGGVVLYRTDDLTRVGELVRMGAVRKIRVSADGAHVLGWGFDSVELWDILKGLLVVEESRSSETMRFEFSPDGRFLAESVSLLVHERGGRFILRDLSNGQPALEQYGAWNFAFSRDGAYLATASAYWTIHVYDILRQCRDGFCQRTSMSHEDSVHWVGFSPSGRLLASHSRDSTIRVWQLPEGDEIARIVTDDRPLTPIGLTDSERQLVLDRGDSVEAWRVPGALDRLLISHQSNGLHLSFSSDGDHLAIETLAGEIELWDVIQGVRKATLPSARSIVSLALGPQGHEIFIKQGGGRGRILDIANGMETEGSRRLEGRILAIDAGWAHGLTQETEGTLGLRNLVDGVSLGSPLVVERQALSAALSSDAATAAIAFTDGNVGVWHTAVEGRKGGFQMLTVPGRRKAGSALAIALLGISADGRRIAVVTGGVHPRILVWDTSSGALLGETTAGAMIFDMALDHSGEHVALASRDRTVRIWNVDDNANVAVRRLDREVMAVDLRRSGPDGRHWIASTGRDNVTRVWAWRPEDLLTLACRGLPRKALTPAEQETYLSDGDDLGACAGGMEPSPEAQPTK